MDRVVIPEDPSGAEPPRRACVACDFEEAMAPAGPVPQAPAESTISLDRLRRAQLSPSSSSPRQSALPERCAEPFLGGREGEASSTIDPA